MAKSDDLLPVVCHAGPADKNPNYRPRRQRAAWGERVGAVGCLVIVGGWFAVWVAWFVWQVWRLP